MIVYCNIYIRNKLEQPIHRYRNKYMILEFDDTCRERERETEREKVQ